MTNPNDDFRAVIYGDQGFLNIRGEKGEPVPVPEGQWKLLSYTIDQTARPKGAEGGGEEAQKKERTGKKGLDVEVLAMARHCLAARPSAGSGAPYSMVAAQATAAYKAVKVGQGGDRLLPFGPPYKPVVTADFFQDGKNTR